jgi:hypothetical protein
MRGGGWEEKFACFAVTKVLKRALKPQNQKSANLFEIKSPILPQRTREGGAWLAVQLSYLLSSRA